MTRDRSLEYARGATAGAPATVQVADRWHLLLNLRERLERFLERCHGRLRTLPLPAAATVGPNHHQVAVTHRRRLRGTSDEAARVARQERRRHRYADVVALYEQGISMRQIANRLGLSRWIVQHFLKAEGYPERLPYRTRSTILTPFEPYLNERWAAGCRNSVLLWRELRAQGFTGSSQTVSRWCQHRRDVPAVTTAKPYRNRFMVADKPHDMPTAPSATSIALAAPPALAPPRELVWLLLREPTTLTSDEQALLLHIRGDAAVAQAYALTRQFVQMVQQRQPAVLDAWKHACHASGVSELKQFASGSGLGRDDAAVRAALTYEWSNGQVEGHITRIKLIKRQMYGRASFDLLRKRILAAA